MEDWSFLHAGELQDPTLQPAKKRDLQDGSFDPPALNGRPPRLQQHPLSYILPSGAACQNLPSFGSHESSIHAKVPAYDGPAASEIPGYSWEMPYLPMYNRSEIGIAQASPNLMGKNLEWQKATGMQPPAGRMKRQRIDQEMNFVQKDALVELARENLMIKHQIHVASLEVQRLKQICGELDSDQGDAKDSKSRYWTEEEHKRFLEAVEKYGHKDVKSISSIVGTRSATQVRTHAQKYFMKMAKSSQPDESTESPEASTTRQKTAQCSSDSVEAAAAAASGETGTSAAAAAAFVAAKSIKQTMVIKQHGAPTVEGDAHHKKKIKNRMATGKGPGSPGSMGSSGSLGSSDSTSNGNESNGVRSSDATNGNGSSGSSHSNGHFNSNGSSSDSGRGDSNNGASSNEGSDHGFFDTAEDDVDNFELEAALV
mmetsp:Transcript_3586/g.8805  ORF Transcript_3586/g.8805 Transcript_3586/m.8805 type:complete len:427 (-) Transcript_3586:161-1441(-)